MPFEVRTGFAVGNRPGIPLPQAEGVPTAIGLVAPRRDNQGRAVDPCGKQLSRGSFRPVRSNRVWAYALGAVSQPFGEKRLEAVALLPSSVSCLIFSAISSGGSADAGPDVPAHGAAPFMLRPLPPGRRSR